LDGIGTWDGWVGAILSGIAVLVGIGLAWWALRSAEKISSRQAELEKELAGRQEQLAQRQTALEEEAYLSSRMQELIQHARTTLAEAQTIQTLTSPRLYELLSMDPTTPTQQEERQRAALESISRLEVEVDLLRIYAVTMPTAGSDHATPSESLKRLMDEGAWLYSEALHCAILSFDPDHLDVELTDDQAVVDALMNGAFVNLNTRLLSDCIGLASDQIPSYSELDSPWPEVYNRREQILRDTVMARKSWSPSSIAEAATWSIAHTVDRFEDALMDVLSEWNSSRRYSAESTAS
jgi:uncharacterized membrane-anchored protein YhcB (DUF1043 family)